MTYLVLDVETVPRVPARKHLATEGADGWDTARDRLVGDWLAKHERVKPGLHPLFSEVAVIAVERGDGTTWCGDALTEGGEKALLERFIKSDVRASMLVTYNGYGFDLPVLMERARLLGVDPRPAWATNPWRHGTDNHYDVMLELAGGAKDRFPYVPLDVAYAVVMEKEPPERPDLETAQASWWRGDPVPLRTRCQADVRMTGELYRRLQG